MRRRDAWHLPLWLALLDALNVGDRVVRRARLWTIGRAGEATCWEDESELPGGPDLMSKPVKTKGNTT